MPKAKDTRSPLKSKPLRNPGQSVEEARLDLIADKGLAYIMYVCILPAVVAYQWWTYFNPPERRMPIASTLLIAILLIVLIPRLFKLYQQLQDYKLGRDAEQEVGRELEKLRRLGVDVFHDIVESNFNIDHVLVSTKGIFVIETKALRKPLQGETKIRFDGDKIYKEGRPLSKPDPIRQARMNAKHVQKILRQSTGKEFPVKPVVLFPGWYVDAKNVAVRSDAWVLNPKALASFIPNEKKIIADEDAQMATFHLERYITAKYQDD